MQAILLPPESDHTKQERSYHEQDLGLLDNGHYSAVKGSVSDANQRNEARRLCANALASVKSSYGQNSKAAKFCFLLKNQPETSLQSTLRDETLVPPEVYHRE